MTLAGQGLHTYIFPEDEFYPHSALNHAKLAEKIKPCYVSTCTNHQAQLPNEEARISHTQTLTKPLLRTAILNIINTRAFWFLNLHSAKYWQRYFKRSPNNRGGKPFQSTPNLSTSCVQRCQVRDLTLRSRSFLKLLGFFGRFFSKFKSPWNSDTHYYTLQTHTDNIGMSGNHSYQCSIKFTLRIKPFVPAWRTLRNDEFRSVIVTKKLWISIVTN